MTTFALGAGVRCDVATLVDTRLLIQGSSGAGKSWAIRRILEQTSGKVQQLVIDPEGEFHTLRERYDFVYAAPHGGETVAQPRSAALLAERLLELGASAILDIFELKPDARKEFVRRFCEALVEIPKRLYHPVLVVLDEGHVFAPEGKEAESSAAVVDLASRGRKRGHGLVLATQRISKLSKDAAAELKNRMIGGTFLDVDMKRAADELGTDKDGMRALRELRFGQFWTFGPAFPEARAPTLVTVGAVQTTHPEPGAKLTAPVPPTPERIRALLPKLADLPAEAEQRARTEKELRQELAESRRRITQLERGAPARVETKLEVQRIEVPVLAGKQLQVFERGTARLEKVGAQLVEVGGQVVTVARDLVQAAKRAASGNGSLPSSRPQMRSGTAQHTGPGRVAPRRAPAPATEVDGERLSAAQQAILSAAGFLESLGIAVPDVVQLALFAGQSATGGYWRANIGRCRSLGLIDGTTLTAAGRARAEASAITTVEKLHAHVLTDLCTKPQRQILQVLIEAYPAALDVNEVGRRAELEPAGGYWRANVGRLRSLGLITKKGPMAALPLLFLEGQ